MSLRSAFVVAVSDLIEADDKLVLCLGDISTFAFKAVAQKYPERVLNLGCTECASVSFAAGLSATGFYPIYHTISPFLARRAYEFLKIDFGLQRLPGLFIGVGGGRDYAKLGPTHRCPEEAGLMSYVDGLTYFAPRTEAAVDVFIRHAVRKRDLVYLSLEEFHV